MIESMIADLVIDFDTHLQNGSVWLVELDLPLQDAPDDVPSSITVDCYVTAHTQHQATYIAQCMYPDSLGCSVSEPITQEEYATRRNRSIC